MMMIFVWNLSEGFLPLQGEGQDGDGMRSWVNQPIPTLALPLKGRDGT